MAGYGCVRTWARQLGEERHAELLQETLDEEELTDKLLTELAETSINIDAETGDDNEEDEKPSRARSNGKKAVAKKTASNSAASADDDDDEESDEDDEDEESDDEVVGVGGGRAGSM
jgi:hypothetical protein